MDNDDIEQLYSHNGARLGVVMTKTLGSLRVTSSAIKKTNRSRGRTVCWTPAKQYHLRATRIDRYGMFLVPLATALTTAKYCQFGQRHSHIIYTVGRTNNETA